MTSDAKIGHQLVINDEDDDDTPKAMMMVFLRQQPIWAKFSFNIILLV